MSFYPARKIATFNSGASLFIGSMATSQNANFMKNNDIDLIVNCTRDIPFFFTNIRSIRVPVNDAVSSNDTFMKHIKDACGIMHQYISAGKSVLVHCAAGISRSASCVAAYLILYSGMSPEEAVGFIKSKKPETFQGDIFMSSLNKLKKKRDY